MSNFNFSNFVNFIYMVYMYYICKTKHRSTFLLFFISKLPTTLHSSFHLYSLATTLWGIYYYHQPILRFRKLRLTEVKSAIQGHMVGKEDGGRIHTRIALSQNLYCKPLTQVRKWGRRQQVQLSPSAHCFCLLAYFWSIKRTLPQAVFFSGIQGHIVLWGARWAVGGQEHSS